jgi:putative tricarboxylic transport membrane protein
MARADFITSLVLMALGLATLAESIRMPRFTDVGGSPYSAPGLVPGMLGAVIAVLGLILCLRSAAALRAAAPGGAEEGEGMGGWLRAAAAFALCGFYAIVMISRVPFWLATFLFVLAFALGFEFIHPEMRERPVRRVIVGVVVAAAVSAAVSYVFQEIFFVRLP